MMMLQSRCLLLVVLLVVGMLLFVSPVVVATSNEPNKQEEKEEETCANNDDKDDDTTPTTSLSPQQQQQQQQEQQAHKFREFLSTMFAVNDAYSGTDRTEQEWFVLQTMMEYLGLDAKSISEPETLTTNIYQVIHDSIMQLAPPDSFFFHVYTGRPTEEQVAMVRIWDPQSLQRATDDDDGSYDDTTFRRLAFRPFRHRGGYATMVQWFHLGILNPLQYWLGFGIPNDAILQAITDLKMPIVEMGAGTGYWSAQLQQEPYSVEVEAYDVAPPDQKEEEKENETNNPTSQNVYFHKTYTNVQKGTCQDVFVASTEDKKETRALLMVWPNNPDRVDNPQFVEENDPHLSDPWDYDCLQSYLQAGGTTVVYVGEREANISLVPKGLPESGISSTRAFQQLLQEQFQLHSQIDVPKWWYEDDATIWVRK